MPIGKGPFQIIKTFCIPNPYQCDRILLRRIIKYISNMIFTIFQLKFCFFKVFTY